MPLYVTCKMTSFSESDRNLNRLLQVVFAPLANRITNLKNLDLKAKATTTCYQCAKKYLWWSKREWEKLLNLRFPLSHPPFFVVRFLIYILNWILEILLIVTLSNSDTTIDIRRYFLNENIIFKWNFIFTASFCFQGSYKINLIMFLNLF